MKSVLYYRYDISHSMLWLTAALLLFTVNGCKKEKADGQNPVIVFHAPSSGSTFAYLDDIFINATVTDESSLEYIRVQIVNAQNHVFLHQTEYTNAGTQKDISVYITHDDLHLASGTYYVKITAKDKDNESIAFREIQLTEAPVELKRIYIVRGNNSVTQVDTMSNAGITPFMSFSNGYQSGAISSRYNLLLANYDDRISVRDATSLAEQISYHYNTSTVLKTVYDTHSQSFFTGTADGYIFQTDRYGNNSIFISLPSQKILNLLVTENYIFADIENLTQTMRTVSVFYKSTRSFVQSVQVYFDLKELVYLGNEDKILAVGNDAGEGILKYYNRTTNFFNEVFTQYNHSTVYGAWPTTANQFIVSHDDGLITYTNNLQMQSVGVDLQPLKIVCEKLSGLNYALKENGVYVLNTNATSQLNFYPSDNCKDVLMLYNK